ncbi:hypothetical protein KC359_g48 [Hortaea werneckii]|nr:hypothetical protein KC359_g48 [Hortaea werneckii]
MYAFLPLAPRPPLKDIERNFSQKERRGPRQERGKYDKELRWGSGCGGGYQEAQMWWYLGFLCFVDSWPRQVMKSEEKKIFGRSASFGSRCAFMQSSWFGIRSFRNGRWLIGRVAGAHLLHRIAAAAAGGLLGPRRETRAPPLFGSGGGQGGVFALVLGPLPRHDEPAVTIGGECSLRRRALRGSLAGC